MSDEIVEDMLEEVAPQAAGDYLEIAQRYKAGEELTDEELDTIAEMEKEKLPYTIEREWWYLPYHGGTGKVGRFGPWAGCITAEFLGY